MNTTNLPRRLMAEFIGTGFLLATVVGSGIMAENLAGGNVAIALMGNTIPTGAILFVLILVFGSVSGAHFNPAVTLGFKLRGDISTPDALLYVAVQLVGGLIGVVVAHIMFDQPIGQISQTPRFGPGQWVSEWVATFGLVMTILGGIRFAPKAVPAAVGLYITAAYWFTASTSFANPAVTIARSFSDTFAGIQPAHMPAFIAAQLIGAVCATYVFGWLFAGKPKSESASS
jgi:glycerol uptake facilitator-like aquaporin